MKILEVILINYNRFRLERIKRFEYRPSERIQIIIGTNGSGKSSLLNELSPLPAHHSHYGENGSKYIKIEHRGSIYELSSTFKGKQAHSFIKDSTELNPGNGTYSAQLELVEKHFNLTPKVHEIFMGQRKFHQLGSNERREWFTRLSDANYDYAIAVYNRLRERTRDLSGAIKIAKKKLEIESTKVYEQKDIDSLEKECHQLYELTAQMQEIRIPENRNMDALYLSQENKAAQLHEQTQRLSRWIKIAYEHHGSLDHIDETLSELKIQSAEMCHHSERLYEEYSRVSQDYEHAHQYRQTSAQSVQKEIQGYHSQIDDLLSKKVLKLSENVDADIAYRNIDKIDEWLAPLTDTLLEYKGQSYTRQDVIDTEQAILDTESKIKVLNERIEKKKAIYDHLSHLKQEDHTTCPQCAYTWIKGYDEKLFQDTLLYLEKAAGYMHQHQKTLKETKETLDKITLFMNTHDRISEIIYKTTYLDELWHDLIAKEVFDRDVGNVSYYLQHYKQDLLRDIEIKALRVKIDQKYKDAQILETHQGLNYEYIAKRKNELEKQIHDLTLHTQDNNQALNYWTKLSKAVTELSASKDALERTVQEYVNQYHADRESLRRMIFNDYLRAIQSVLASKEALLHSIKSHQGTIESIETQISVLQKEENGLKAACQVLSPTDGLIAEGMSGFMKLFIEQMNELIKKIWTYPLYIMPCGLSKEGKLDLDYKFPLVVDTADNIRKDIAEGSSAMKEVVDLAFVATAMKAMGMEDYPLFLDEFGSNMDPTHKAATIDLINVIIGQSHFPQLFMVSHDTVQYGALSNIEMCVISEKNMMLPKGTIYNQHVSIE